MKTQASQAIDQMMIASFSVVERIMKKMQVDEVGCVNSQGK